MNKFVYSFLLIPLLLLSCKKSNNVGDSDQENKPSYTVNIYEPSSMYDEFDMPQITVKNEQLQITALGYNYGGLPRHIGKLYLSEADSGTEWIIVFDEHGKPSFMYEINSSTGKQEPFLYSFEKVGNDVSYVRYYTYDWTNRLGTLQYEVKFANGQQEVLFENSAGVTASMKDDQRDVLSRNSLRSAVVSKGGRQAIIGKPGKKDANIAFAAPVAAFDRLMSIPQRPLLAASDDDDISEWLDGAMDDFLKTVKDSYNDALNKVCAVNILSRFKGSACGITEAVKEFTDQNTVNELNDARRQQEQQQNPAQRQLYSGDNTNLNIGIFPDINRITESIGDHLNGLGDRLTARYNRFSDWISDLQESATPNGEDLDDLPDSNGVLQIGLSWNTTSDIDLHVTDPSGNTINYYNPTSPTGGYLDRDDVDGIGPENIYWRSNVPDGTYIVKVHYYASNEAGVPASRCAVKVSNGLGVSQEFTGTLTTEDQMATVCRFTKNGSNITFQ
ncbi:YfaP family protein [Parapedobacter pyrenivorans]|uniref:YfaP family protein n=1 Tax=Parapedobacter pyrenivorans TaxID=1305674 RepID=UPI003341BD1D